MSANLSYLVAMDADEEQVKRLGSTLERAAWLLVLAGMASQTSASHSFPSYNPLLGFWGAYATYTRHGKATFGFIAFASLAVILDIVFCSINSADSDIFRFSLSMLIICMALKVYAIYYACQFFGAIGGAAQIDPSILTSSRYSSASASAAASRATRSPYASGMLASQMVGGGYYAQAASPGSSQLLDDREIDDGSSLLR